MGMFIPAVVVLLILVVAVGFLIKGVFGPAAAVAYTKSVRGVAVFIGRHLIRFLRWTLANHWQFWLGFVVGVFAMLYFLGRLP
jgi:hypothetical protein